ncbi:hypothetical protein GOODEAATRI_032535 [Goodea atripinnis]|uniref:Endonuclease/exonuclease/phosphatase domain-containing protein n=1 Tax=Goodea atripinnis TaxID=208336 RepID=A0ABV0NPZ1_9TELE
MDIDSCSKEVATAGCAIVLLLALIPRHIKRWANLTLDYLAVQVKVPARALFLNGYRRPTSKANFFNDFNDLLSVKCVEYDCLIIVGDFNIDNPEDKGAKEHYDTLENVGLTRHVKQPTNKRGLYHQ